MKKTKKIVGLMSGTSANGVDAALVEIIGTGQSSRVKLLDFDVYPYPKKLKNWILKISSDSSSAAYICTLNFFLGEIFAEASSNIAAKAGVKLSDIDLIGSHGQTIYHMPIIDNSPFSTPSTLQIGEPAVIAEKTGITTVADFRTRDIAAGGIGAPLTPYANFILFSDPKKTRIIQNIGGISNLTLIPKGNHITDVVSFDTGPGNMIIDSLVSLLTNKTKDYDKDGLLASKGVVNKKLLGEFLDHPFLKKKPPKSSGREDFGYNFTKNIFDFANKENIRMEDLLTTATAFTVESIVTSYEQFIFPKFSIDEVIISGGGVHNLTLIQMLKKRLKNINVLPSDEYNFPACALEAVSFAILANDSIEGIPNNLPNVTGAKKEVVLGKILF